MRSGRSGGLPRFAGQDPEVAALVAAVLATGVGIPAVAATVDATSGSENWSNSGELPLNALIGLVPAAGSLAGGAFAAGIDQPAAIELQRQLAMHSPEYRERRRADAVVTDKLLKGEMISQEEYDRVMTAAEAVREKEKEIDALYREEAQRYRRENDTGGAVMDAFQIPGSRRISEEEAMRIVKQKGIRHLLGGALLGGIATLPSMSNMLEDQGA